MLTIIIPGKEVYDEEKNEFYYEIEPFVLKLEHSLVSLSKWESKWEKPFLSEKPKTSEEALNYIEMMVLNKKIPENLFSRLSPENIKEIDEYINSKQSATWFSEINAPKSREVITNELIYYWMFAAGIAIECENWHLNRLFSVIKIAGLKSSKPKKMSRSEIAARQRELNTQRLKEMGTTG